jgi:putative oxidoreductase
MKPTLDTLLNFWRNETPALRALIALRSPLLLLTRLYVAQVFFLSGLTKIQDWSTTLLLFTEEYHVPLLPPQLAAIMGTAGELVLPVLLVLGFAGRFAALGLFVVNAMAVVSLAEIAPAALQQHLFWAWLIAFLAIMGMGRWAMDEVLKKRLLNAA